MTAAKKSPRKPRPSATTSPAKPAVPDTTAASVQVLRRFRVVFNAVKAHFRQVEKHVGIGGAQLWALGVIRAQPDIGMTGLARAMDVHQSTASNLVKALVERELIGVARHGSDRRMVTLRVLPKGLRVLKKAPGPFAGVLPEAVASLDAATLKRMDRDLGRLIAALHADEHAASIPLAQL